MESEKRITNEEEDLRKKDDVLGGFLRCEEVRRRYGIYRPRLPEGG